MLSSPRVRCNNNLKVACFCWPENYLGYFSTSMQFQHNIRIAIGDTCGIFAIAITLAHHGYTPCSSQFAKDCLPISCLTGTNLYMNKFVLLSFLFLYVNMFVYVPPTRSPPLRRPEPLVKHLQINASIFRPTLLFLCVIALILPNLDLNCRFISLNTRLNT